MIIDGHANYLRTGIYGCSQIFKYLVSQRCQSLKLFFGCLVSVFPITLSYMKFRTETFCEQAVVNMKINVTALILL